MDSTYHYRKDNVADIPLAACHGVPTLRLLLGRMFLFGDVGALHFACSIACAADDGRGVVGSVGSSSGEGVRRSPDGGAGHSARVFAGNGL